MKSATSPLAVTARSLLAACAALALLVGTQFLAGCAVAETSVEEVGSQVQQGLQGRGKIVPYDPTSDSFGPDFQ